jgi:hypothetical protein
MSWLTKLREQTGAHAGDDARKPFLTRLRATAEAVQAEGDEHPWMETLRKLKGRVGADGIERISTGDVFDTLLVPIKKRPGLTLQLSRMMRDLGWSNIRAWGLNVHSTLSRVRGFARPTAGSKALM